MSNLTAFVADTSSLTGTIPSQVGMMTSMLTFLVYTNSLTGSIPSEFGNLESLEQLIVSGNSMTGTIPSQLGQLDNLEFLGLRYNHVTGTIPSTLDQLINLETFELDNNKLTGSVPLSILSNQIKSLYLYENQLSDLIPVEGQIICSSIDNATGVEGEHYCNCASDCVSSMKSSYFAESCQCEEAKDCCDKYFVDNDINNCVFCEAEEGFSNPDFRVAEWGYASCDEAAGYVYTALDEFGTEEQCNIIKFEAYTLGCICSNYVPPVPEEDADLPL